MSKHTIGLDTVQISPDLYCARGAGSGQYTIFTARRRRIYSFDGVRAVIEESMIPAATALLRSTPGNAIANELHVSETRIGHLRQALDVQFSRGGSRRGGNWLPAAKKPLDLKRIAVLGTGMGAVILVTQSGTFSRLAGAMVIIEDAATEALTEYLRATRARDVAEECQVRIQVVTAMRSQCGISSRTND